MDFFRFTFRDYDYAFLEKALRGGFRLLQTSSTGRFSFLDVFVVIIWKVYCRFAGMELEHSFDYLEYFLILLKGSVSPCMSGSTMCL